MNTMQKQFVQMMRACAKAGLDHSFMISAIRDDMAAEALLNQDPVRPGVITYGEILKSRAKKKKPKRGKKAA